MVGEGWTEQLEQTPMAAWQLAPTVAAGLRREWGPEWKQLRALRAGR